jgi:hypothetical protein
MNKKIFIGSLAIVFLIVSAGLTPLAASQDDIEQMVNKNLVAIEVSYYQQKNPDRVQTMVSSVEAEEIKQILIALHYAIQTNDNDAMLYYENLLIKKGIIEDSYHKISPSKIPNSFSENIPRLPFLNTISDDNISNSNCYFNVIGEGTALWGIAHQFYENIIRIIRNASTVIEAFVLLLIFLPFLALAIIFSNLIPFRLFCPSGIVSVKNATVVTRGDLGEKKLDVGPDSINLNVTLFTGISINIPGLENRNSFLFITGFASQVLLKN